MFYSPSFESPSTCFTHLSSSSTSLVDDFNLVIVEFDLEWLYLFLRPKFSCLEIGYHVLINYFVGIIRSHAVIVILGILGFALLYNSFIWEIP